MAKEPELQSDKTKNFERRLPCRNCDNSTFHKVLSSINKHESEQYTDYWHDFEIVICQGCRELSFRSNWTFSEDIDVDAESGMPYLIDHEDIFPNRVLGRKELKDLDFLPIPLLKIYKETYIAITNKAPILAGVGIRALVEAICKDKGATGKNLEAKIDNLIELKVLTEEGAEILHSTRMIGNQAAHELNACEEKDLEVAMNLIEHILLGVYILPRKAINLPKRKNALAPMNEKLPVDQV